MPTRQCLQGQNQGERDVGKRVGEITRRVPDWGHEKHLGLKNNGNGHLFPTGVGEEQKPLLIVNTEVYDL